MLPSGEENVESFLPTMEYGTPLWEAENVVQYLCC